MEKCKLHTLTVKYLGFLISDNSIKPDPARFKLIQTMRAPSNVKEVRSLEGPSKLLRQVCTKPALTQSAVRSANQEKCSLRMDFKNEKSFRRC